MKYLFILLGVGLMWACNPVTIGFLKTKNAAYLPDSMEIRKNLDPELDKIRIKNMAPWVTPKIQGVLGTNPILFEFVGVKADTEEAAGIFRQEIQVKGAGMMQLPLYTDLPVGRYTVTLKVSNEDHSALLENIFTFIVK